MGVERAGDGGDRAGADLVAPRDQVGELAHDPLAELHLALLAVERQQVAAQEHAAVEMGLERPQDRVLAAGQLRRDFVGQLDLRSHPCRAARTSPGHALAVGAAVDLGHRLAHGRPHVLRAGGAAVGDGAGDDRLQVVVGQLGREVGGDQLGLGLLAAREVLAAALTEGARPPPRGVCAHDAAPPARRRFLPWRPSAAPRDQPQSAHLRFVPGAHGVLQVGVDLIADPHALQRQGYAARPAIPDGAGRREVLRSRPAASGLPKRPGEEESRPNSSATFQSTSRRRRRPRPGISSRW